MKIGILTFHRALNYGAKLQAYALMTKLKETYKTEIIDYRCEAIENDYFRTNKVKTLLKSIVFPKYMRDQRIRAKRFRDFDKRLVLSSLYYINNIKDVNLCFDKIICGSDQIWNPFLTGYDYTYLLDFAEKKKACSYAISLGKGQPSDWDTSKLETCLRKYKSILVRESNSISILQKFDSSLSVKSVLDPVFLLNRKQWIDNFLLVKKMTEKYIFMYIVAKHDIAIQRAQHIAKDKGYKIYFVDGGRSKYDGVTNINNLGPLEFLKLLFNAEMVVTTSFHALALSLILNIPFEFELSKVKVNANSRLEELREIYSLGLYEIKSIDQNNYFEYDWNTINTIIKRKQKESLCLLKHQLES